MVRKLRLVTTYEAAKRLRVHPKTVSRLMRQGKLSGVKVANRWLINENTFETFGKTYIGSQGRPKGYSPKRSGK